MSFLKAHWKNLIMVNYDIDPKILEPYIPKHTSLDLFEGRCLISLVGFMFKDTKVLGLKFPNHINFEEVNLRFYVKHNDKRAVVFIKEIVPKSLITFIANTFYNEHYETHQMEHVNDSKNNSYSYHWNHNGSKQQFSVKTKNNSISLQPNSEAEFIAEHYYGYTKHKNRTFEYEVKHPSWLQKEVIDYNINVDFQLVYGSKFKILNTTKPSSVFLAEGSLISVENKSLIKAIDGQ
jgi:uncharacterized protein YqjF (DUF2071 family)